MLCESHLEQDFTIEMNACRPLLVNEHFYPFCSDKTKTFVIFPYDVTEDENTPISFTDYSSRYPLAGVYLAMNDYGKKLLFPYMSSRPYFVYTNQEDLLIYAGYAIFCESERELQILKRILESDIFWYYIKNTSKQNSHQPSRLLFDFSNP